MWSSGAGGTRHFVVFGPDHPTTGGYPVIAVVAAPSLDTLAHLTPGAEVHLHA